MVGNNLFAAASWDMIFGVGPRSLSVVWFLFAVSACLTGGSVT